MPSTLKISPPDVKRTISRGGTDKATLTVTKAYGAFVGYAGEPEPATYRGWVSMKPDSLALLPPDIPSKDVELRITVPQDAPYGLMTSRYSLWPRNRWLPKMILWTLPASISMLTCQCLGYNCIVGRRDFLVVVIFIVAIVVAREILQ